MGENIDNAPKNTMELKKRDSWKVKLSGTAVTVTSTSAISMIGSAAVDSTDSTKIVPKNDIAAADFDDLWLVGDYDTTSSDTNAGFVAIHMMNCLSTGGFSMQTADDEKGKFAFEYTAHYSMDEQDTVPFEIYIKSPTT